jgi:hypothetical protein
MDLIDAPAILSFTETHGIVHSTPALAPTYEQPITNPSSPQQFSLVHQEQLDVMARSLIDAKTESEELKRKCAKLQQTINQLRESTLHPKEEGELSRNASRSNQKDQSMAINAEPGLYALASGFHEVSV